MDWLKRRLLIGGVSGVIALLYWQFGGGRASGSSTVDTIPQVVWGGGGSTMTVEARVSAPAELRMNFAEQGEHGRRLNARQTIPAGSQRWQVRTAPGSSFYAEVQIPHPPVGAEIEWTVRCGERQVAQETSRLEHPLAADEGFFVQVELNDATACQ